MNDAYTSALFDVVRDTSANYGYSLPEHLEAYVVMLLASHVDKPNFLPSNSFAEKYLSLNTKMDAKQLGDTCLFVTGVFPSYGKINRTYYQNIGIGSYSSMNGELFEQLATHFKFLSNFIELSVNTSKHAPNNLFR